MTSELFPTVLTEGSPYQRGYQHGSLAKERIERGVHLYSAAFQRSANLEWGQVLKVATRFLPMIEEYDAEILEEMRGIADGAGRQLGEIVALNSRTELLFATAEMGEACTAVAVTPEASATGHTLIGQNWDWRTACTETAILLKIKQERGPIILTFVEAGMVARNGLNSAGIGVCGTYIESDRDRKQLGIPIPLVRRQVLSSENLSDAVAALFRVKRSASTNFLIAHRDGEVINLEATPGDIYHLYPKQGVLIHTNHFRLRVGDLRDVGMGRFPDTIVRLQRVQRMLNRKRGAIGINTVQQVFRDHFGYPNSICRHPDERRDPIDRIQTVGSIIMDLNEGKVFFADGPPCETDYRTIELGKV